MILFGKLELTSHGLQMQNPQYEILQAESDTPEDPVAQDFSPASAENTLHTGRIVPVCEKTGHLTAKVQRALVHHALEQLPGAIADPLPAGMRAELQLVDRRTALHDVHFPRGHAGRTAQRVQVSRAAADDLRGVLPLPARADPAQAARGSRSEAAFGGDHRRDPRVGAQRPPFRLTHDQKTVIAEIVADMKRPRR